MRSLLLIFGCWLLLLAPAVPQETAVSLTTKATVAQLAPGQKMQVQFQFTIGTEWHLYAPVQAGQELIGIPVSITPVAQNGFRFSQPVYPQAIVKKVMGEEQHLYEGQITVVVEVEATPQVPNGKQRLEFTVEYQGCTDKLCATPVQKQEIVWIEVSGSQAATQEPATTKPSTTTSVPKASGEVPKPQESLLWLFALVFVGGIITSLTPCVYPMIPLTISFFANQSKSKSRTQILGLALIFVMGIATLYSGLGVATAIFKQGFNRVIQSPWVLGAMAAIFLALGLSFFGLFAIRLPSFITNRAKVKRGGVLGAFGRGLFLGIVAAPCMGPITVAILPLVPDNPLLGGLLLFVYAWGIGIPFIILALSASLLPKGGSWLYGIELGLGCVIIYVALFFFDMIAPWQATAIVTGGLFLALTIWLLWGYFKVAKSWLRLGFAIVALLGTIAFWPGFAIGIPESESAATGAPISSKPDFSTPLPKYLLDRLFFYGDSWEKDFAKALETARAQHKPLVVDFWAKWCIPCRVMDKTILKEPAVIAELQRFVKVKLDVTIYDATQDAIQKQHGIFGPPSFVFYDSQGNWLKGQTIHGKVDSSQTFLQVLQQVK